MTGNIIELFFEFLNLFSSCEKGRKNNDREATQHFKSVR